MGAPNTIVKSKKKFVVQEKQPEEERPWQLNGTINLRELEIESQKAQSKFRREDRHNAEVNYQKLLYEVQGNKMKLVAMCPCGKHKGILFYDDCKLLSGESLCPITVWLTWARKSIRDGSWREFLQTKPLENFLSGFKVL